jgi:hypothetical protein
VLADSRAEILLKKLVSFARASLVPECGATVPRRIPSIKV